MANRITDEMLDYVAILAKLELSDQEKQAVRTDMERMLDHIDKLEELDTSQIEPMSHAFASVNVFREDVVTNADGHVQTLSNAPQKKGRSFVVPKTIA